MVRCLFTNLEQELINYLNTSEKSIEAAVAWINFDLYGILLESLVKRGVELQILLNDDLINQKDSPFICYLNGLGANIKMVRFEGIMHHKFCVIDKKICLFGSFNWTRNANTRNIEDLNICDDPSFVYSYLEEFKALWELSQQDIKLLSDPHYCPTCGNPIINIMFIEQEGDDQTKIIVVQKCGCKENVVAENYFDLCVYSNLIGVSHYLEEEIEEAYSNENLACYERLIAARDFKVRNYLSNVRQNRMQIPIIHAVGAKVWDETNKDDGQWIYKILWRERGTKAYIGDVYEIG